MHTCEAIKLQPKLNGQFCDYGIHSSAFTNLFFTHFEKNWFFRVKFVMTCQEVRVSEKLEVWLITALRVKVRFVVGFLNET